MSTAVRPLELRLRSELDLSGTQRFEAESRSALVNELSRQTINHRRRFLTIAVPLAVLATIAIGFALAY